MTSRFRCAQRSRNIAQGTIAACIALWAIAAEAGELPIVANVDRQPLVAQARRVVQALDMLGAPLNKTQRAQLDAATGRDDAQQAVKEIQAVLDPLCLALVTLDPASRVRATAGPAPRQLIQHGWRTFLVKVHNPSGSTAPLRLFSRNARTLAKISINTPIPPQHLTAKDVQDRWMEIDLVNRQPLAERLSGLELEYWLVALYSRDAGQRTAKFVFDVAQGPPDFESPTAVEIAFDCAPAVQVDLTVQDYDGLPATAHFTIRDAAGRVYPGLSRRLAPDMYFHEQVYRQSGESVLLPAGDYQVAYGRGPEYRLLTRTIRVPAAKRHHELFRLQRWIHLAERGWFSGDHHVHAAGCAHYDSPTQGITPADMLRQILGEDLNVGCVLSWGPCWYHQKQFFEGRTHKLSTPRHLMRYDVEVSGFPSSHAGHVCLLRIREDDFPGTKTTTDWPSWDLPILEWGKKQGGVVGFAHSGFGLQTKATTLPNYEMPPFDGIGANEYIVDVTHDACDFISTVDTPSHWELNIWYHTLNCGYTTRVSGETDFPCISGERMGMGRAYVKLPTNRPLDYDAWVQGIGDGRSYVSDGFGHLFDFSVNGLEVGAPGADGRASVLRIASGDELVVRVQAAALLQKEPNEKIRSARLDEQPYWHIERARIERTMQVPVELIVNGQMVETQTVMADGQIHELTFNLRRTRVPKRSSWVALRIFPSVHTNPVFVEVDDQPIRASRRSAAWCRRAVDVCWQQKQKKIRPTERAAAAAAYDHARRAYEKILKESSVE